MQINASGGKSGQVTEDYMLSGTCIYSFFPVFFFFCAVTARIRACLCMRACICSNIYARVRFYMHRLNK